MNEDRIWNNLKINILKLSGIESIEPKDCKILSQSISKSTKKNISETTLKRIFGFAASPTKASLYTRNALAQYCGYVDWAEYALSIYNKPARLADRSISWKNMQEETNKVNFFTLSAVKNKAIIPFTEMTERKFIYDHFAGFEASGALATVIASPTGYGKTIAICQWVTRKLSMAGGKDLILYLNSSFLLSSLKTSVNLEYWMMKMIGLEPSQDFRELAFDETNIDGKFYFVIDGFDEFMFNKSQFEVFTHLLLDILSIYKLSKWFKIVILMRDSTWMNWRKQLITDQSSWFLGKMNDEGQNVGLLDLTELSSLMDMKRSFTDKEMSSGDFSALRFPLFHLYFYKRYNTIIRYEQFNEVLLYELATDYVSQNITYGNQALHKMHFIFYLLNKIEWVDRAYKINKSKIPLHHKALVNTYSSLIQIGFIWEVESSPALNRRVYINFIHYHILACCIAAFLMKDDPDFSIIKLEYIYQRWDKDETLALNILKWCVFQSIPLGKQEEWIKGYEENLAPDDLKKIISFVVKVRTYQL